MSGIEIALLIVGAVIFVLSFLIPVKKDEADGDLKAIVSEEVHSRMETEVEQLRKHVDSVVDEAVEYAQEKTERSLERISNEKIMAVNEYSDTVLDEINKNHKEVMFLYDMLNDKQKELKETVNEVNQVAKAAEETAKEAALASSTAGGEKAEKKPEFESLGGKRVTVKTVLGESKPETAGPASGVIAPPKGTLKEPLVSKFNWAQMAVEDAGSAPAEEETVCVTPPADSAEVKEAFTPSAPEKAAPRVPDNEGTVKAPQAMLRTQILDMYKEGKTSVEIAKALGIGVGEVELVIGLHGK